MQSTLTVAQLREALQRIEQEYLEKQSDLAVALAFYSVARRQLDKAKNEAQNIVNVEATLRAALEEALEEERKSSAQSSAPGASADGSGASSSTQAVVSAFLEVKSAVW